MKKINSYLLLHNVTKKTFATLNQHLTILDEEQRKRVIINVRMQLAHLRQYLRDASEQMDEAERNEILDKLITLTKLLAELEK